MCFKESEDLEEHLETCRGESSPRKRVKRSKGEKERKDRKDTEDKRKDKKQETQVDVPGEKAMQISPEVKQEVLSEKGKDEALLPASRLTQEPVPSSTQVLVPP